MKIKEIMVMTLLTRCWNLFLELDSQHPNEQKILWKVFINVNM